MNITFNEHNAHRLLKELSFPRLGGTPQERKAAALLRKYLSSFGLNAREETFPVQTFEALGASVTVASPYRKEYAAKILGNSGSTPPGGVRGEVVHFDSFASELLKAARNKIALVYSGNINKTFYQRLRQNKVKALIRVGDAGPALVNLKLSDYFTRAFGKIPSVIIGYDDGLEMIRREVKMASVVCRQRESVATSRNVIAEIPGTELPNERIVICAHYDSVNTSPGSADNGGGSVTIAEFARCFRANPPKRTLTFIWFGSEEMGLKGSWAYVQRHKKELAKPKPPVALDTPQVRLVINVDLAGTVLGHNGAEVCGSEAMANFVDGFAKESGLPFETRHSAYSSDNIPFNESYIPSIALHRYSGNYGHTHLDNTRLVGPSGLKLLGQFGLELVSRIANAVEIPFDLNIPDADKKNTWEYVERANPYYRRPC